MPFTSFSTELFRRGGPLLFAGGLLALANFAAAADLNVPMVFPTIQGAIVVAQAGDVVIVEPGIYFENLNFLGKAITVRSSTLDPTTTIVDGDLLGSVVTFVSGEEATSIIEGFTLRGGSGFMVDAGTFAGGGVICLGSSPIIRNNIIRENTATFGGGVAVAFGSNAEVRDNSIESNSAIAAGGGVVAAQGGSPLFIGNQVSANTSGDDGGGFAMVQVVVQLYDNEILNNSATGTGGGVLLMDDFNLALVSGNTIAGNTAQSGAGFAAVNMPYELADCQIVGNTATGVGGGVYSVGLNLARVRACSIGENMASSGAGAYFEADFPVVELCLVVGNQSNSLGGGIYFNGSAGALIGNQVTSNIAVSGGGGVLLSNGASTITNTTIAGNSATAAAGRGGGLDLRNSNSLVENSILFGNNAAISPDLSLLSSTPTLNYCDLGVPWSGAGVGNISADPLFVAPVVGDFHLTSGSPCFNAGFNAAAAGLSLDIDGAARVVCGIVDIGADELEPPLGGCPALLVRGDCGGNGGVEITDAMIVLFFLFGGIDASPCHSACDLDDDGAIELDDAIFLLNALFLVGAPPPAAPYPDCGSDPTPDALGCLTDTCP
ncbi:MAG: choice-of-anchor Q domain-containing protein [Planctomycetota bacterium]